MPAIGQSYDLAELTFPEFENWVEQAFDETLRAFEKGKGNNNNSDSSDEDHDPIAAVKGGRQATAVELEQDDGGFPLLPEDWKEEFRQWKEGRKKGSMLDCKKDVFRAYVTNHYRE